MPTSACRRAVAVFSSFLFCATPVSGDTTSPDVPADEPVPVHERVLEMLRTQEGVVSRPLPELHPARTTFNAEAPIPPQCYTKTSGQFNPCYICHQNPVPERENTMADGGLQVAYAFSDVGMTNHWKNLFEDRSQAVSRISDEEITAWVDEDNYSALAPRLEAAEFSGWIPDLNNLHLAAAAFDDEGFALDGSHWVAFSYKPLPSTFWPTNGSTDDVMIRLSESFRSDRLGRYSREVYKANLALVELSVKGFERIGSLPIDESVVAVDLNRDGEFGVVTEVLARKHYVGAAEQRLTSSYLYPQDTEFLHTVRYVGVNDEGAIVVPPRMKEVRYMRKWKAYNRAIYEREYQLENFAKEAARLPSYQLIGDHGLDNGFGWSVQGFIEGHDGELRTLSYEENLFCMGCHSSVGATIDKTFGFPRKVDGAAGWGYIELRGMPDAPNIGESRGEIATYLDRVGGGGEFRSNPEMFERWFSEDGSVNEAALAGARDVYDLIAPSPGRALELNKAYRVIVAEQDFIYGRDATVAPPENVYRHIDNDAAPTLPIDRFFAWDMRLDWDAALEAAAAEEDGFESVTGE